MSLEHLSSVEHLQSKFAEGRQVEAIRNLASDASSSMASLIPSDGFASSLAEVDEWLARDVSEATAPDTAEAMMTLSGILNAYGRKTFSLPDSAMVENQYSAFGVQIGDTLADLDIQAGRRIVGAAQETLIRERQSDTVSVTIGQRVLGSYNISLRHNASNACDELADELTEGFTRLAEPGELTTAVELALLADVLYQHQVAWFVFPPPEGIKLRNAPANSSNPNHKAVLTAIRQMELADNPTITTDRAEIDELVWGVVSPDVVAIKPQGIKEVREHFRTPA